MLSFCHNTRVWQTDGQTDGRTDRISTAISCVCASHSRTVKMYVILCTLWHMGMRQKGSKDKGKNCSFRVTVPLPVTKSWLRHWLWVWLPFTSAVDCLVAEMTYMILVSRRDAECYSRSLTVPRNYSPILLLIFSERVRAVNDWLIPFKNWSNIAVR